MPALGRVHGRVAGRDVQVLGISCDPLPALRAWADSLGGVAYPLCSDFWPHGAVSRAYGVFDEERGRAERAIVIVDEGGTVRYIDVHSLREVPDEEEIVAEVDGLKPLSGSG